MQVPFVNNKHHPLLFPLLRCRAQQPCVVEHTHVKETVNNFTTLVAQHDNSLLVQQLEALVDALVVRVTTAEARLEVAQAAAELARLPLPPEIRDRLKLV